MRAVDDTTFVSLADILRPAAAPLVAAAVGEEPPAPAVTPDRAGDRRVPAAREYDAQTARAQRSRRRVAGCVMGTALFGRAVDARGVPLDGGAPPAGARYPVTPAVPAPKARVAVCEPFHTGVRALDGPLAFGRGARIGIFGSPGAGKSTLLQTIVAHHGADATVVALVGERGREAEQWLTRIGERTTVVCATADRPAAERARAAQFAFAHACALRAAGLHVLLVVDSLARVAAAARETAVAAHEPLGRGGYPPSVFARQARLLECAGTTTAGSITLLATVLTDGPADLDPVAEAAKAALDGHLVLSARLAAAGWFPAIDVPSSASRTLADVLPPAQRAAAGRVRAALARLEAVRETRALGLDPAAGDPALARAIAAEPRLAAFLRQTEGGADPSETLMEMTALADILDDGYLQ